MKEVEDLTHDMPTQKCLGCSKDCNRATCMTDENAPSPNDITVCASCGHVMAYDENLKFRPLTDQEKIEVTENTEIGRLLQYRSIFNKYIKIKDKQ